MVENDGKAILSLSQPQRIYSFWGCSTLVMNKWSIFHQEGHGKQRDIKNGEVARLSDLRSATGITATGITLISLCVQIHKGGGVLRGRKC